MLTKHIEVKKTVNIQQENVTNKIITKKYLKFVFQILVSMILCIHIYIYT